MRIMSLVQYIKDGTLTTPKGFKVAGVHAGIKESGLDLGAIYSEVPATAAAVYTTNYVQAEPLQVTRDSIATEQKLQAVIVNSGNANACTGEQGRLNALAMRDTLADKLSLPSHLVAVASTGIIGVQLPVAKVINHIPQLDLQATDEAAIAFNDAILTTDTFSKKTCYQAIIQGKTITVSGSAKGSGMIEPNMATMLGFITTDLNIDPNALDAALKKVTNTSFNCITVDGDTSTNDNVIMMANGCAGNEVLTDRSTDWPIFMELLTAVTTDLAKLIARDGEGATKLIEVTVKGALSEEDARKVAKSVVGSSLVKTAIYGSDANWGRILAAVGYSGVIINPQLIDTSIGPITMLKDGQPLDFSEAEAKDYLQEDTIHIDIDLKLGEQTGKAWGCDLTYDYVKINASYRS